ncbi:response regulator [Neorhizobium sp. LMR1-1-1.1]
MDYIDDVIVTPECSGTAVLIADPFVERSASLALRLSGLGYAVVRCSTLADARSACLEARPVYVVTELPFPDGSGMDLVRLIAAHFPSTRTVVHTWFADVPTAVAAAKAGAYDVVPKPTDEEFLVNILLNGADRVPGDCRIQSPGRVRQEHIEQIMKFTSSNVSAAARKLHLDRRSLQRMLKRYEDRARSQLTVDQ